MHCRSLSYGLALGVSVALHAALLSVGAWQWGGSRGGVISASLGSGDAVGIEVSLVRRTSRAPVSQEAVAPPLPPVPASTWGFGESVVVPTVVRESAVLPASEDALLPALEDLAPPPISGGGVTGVVAVSAVRPEYPVRCARLRHEGVTVLDVRLDQWGKVVSAQVIQSAGCEELDAAALKAIRASRFVQEPMADGPLPERILQRVTFRLPGHLHRIGSL